MSLKRLVSLMIAITFACAITLTGCGSSDTATTDDSQDTVAQALGDYTFVASSLTDEGAAEEVDAYFTIPSSRDENVRVNVGVTMPALEQGEKAPVVVLVHGFEGSKDEEFGFYANATDEEYDYPSIAEKLLENGIGTIRMDMPGMGESEDALVNYNLDNCVSDLQDAYDYCMANFAFDADKVGLVGWSMGGKIGPKFMTSNSNIKTAVWLNPAGDNGNTSLLTAAAAGLDWDNLEAAAKESEDGTVFDQTVADWGVEDATLSLSFFESVDASTTGDEIKAFCEEEGNHALLIWGDKDSVINPDTYAWLLENTDVEDYCIKNMDHDLGLESNGPEFTNEVVKTTVDYLVKYVQ